MLLRCGAIPEPTFIWWDLRLQPRYGTLEIRVMDAQTRIRDTAALAALVQCLVRLESLDGFAEPEDTPEAMDENRFLAARDGIAAQLLDPSAAARCPPPGRLATLVDACWPHARALAASASCSTARPPRRRPRRDAPARDRGRAGRPARPAARAAGRLLAAAAASRRGGRTDSSGRGCPDPGRCPRTGRVGGDSGGPGAQLPSPPRSLRT